ncbi:hypothetical protein [Pseudomonas songnenensis]|uniref:Uncharacterized protein n=1 Tax=Pseudomonas songnenensis TaxID=1176259 RepID=A0A482U9I8_9PSED|nr:hypothetical protein [Pseudomonas songnenensis]RYJ63245.1 hypothetical protein EJA06_004640 [Pseudomonas songnenensis]
MNILTEARLALVARLQTITVANGYRTNAGQNVVTGWLKEKLESEHSTFPMICLQKAPGGDPVQGPGVIMVSPAFYVIGAVDAGLDDYDSALEDIELDLIRCLITPKGPQIEWMPRGTNAVSLSTTEHFPPGNGERASVVTLPIQLAINIRP